MSSPLLRAVAATVERVLRPSSMTVAAEPRCGRSSTRRPRRRWPRCSVSMQRRLRCGRRMPSATMFTPLRWLIAGPLPTSVISSTNSPSSRAHLPSTAKPTPPSSSRCTAATRLPTNTCAASANTRYIRNRWAAISTHGKQPTAGSTIRFLLRRQLSRLGSAFALTIRQR